MISKKWLDRREELIKAIEVDGTTYRELGHRYGVTRERIRQVYRLLLSNDRIKEREAHHGET